jgi:hypothetical protein
MRKTLLATAAALALGISGLAMANPCSDNSWSCDQKNKEGNNYLSNKVATQQDGTYNANEVNDQAKVFQNSFNKTAVVAATKLDGEVSHVHVSDLGNTAYNEGNANGGAGGDGGKGIGGKGGKAVAIAGNGGDGGKGGKGVGIGGDARAYSGDAKARGGNAVAASVGVGGYASAENEVQADPSKMIAKSKGGDGSAGDAKAIGGDPSATSGYAKATGGAGSGKGGAGGDGGDGGWAQAQAGNGGNAAGGTGGDGGNGGTIRVSAGTFDMSNQMSQVGQSAAGLMIASQNSGAASLVQQGVTVQANLTVGH